MTSQRTILLRALSAGTCLAVVLLSIVACERRAPSAPGDASRIVALAPSLTEILFALGLGDRVVGVGDFSNWPAEVESKPRLGGLFDPRLEEIVRLDPDLAVLLPSETDLGRKLGNLGIEVLTVGSDSLVEVEEAILGIAQRCGVSDRGQGMVAEWRRALKPEESVVPLRVVLVIDRRAGDLSDLLVAGPGTFLDELLLRAGARNVFADSPLAYPQVGLDELLIRRPEMVIELQSGSLVPSSLLSDWQEMRGMPVTGSGCLAVISGDHVLLPGPRLPLLYAELRRELNECRNQS